MGMSMARCFSTSHLRSARKQAGYTQKKAAEALDVSYQTYQYWESGKQLPRVDKVLKIALIGFRGLMLQALFATPNSLLKPLKEKGFKEARMTTIGLYDIGKSHDPGIQQEPHRIMW
jgi:DNA-binding XRE family transcriptional regulator